MDNTENTEPDTTPDIEPDPEPTGDNTPSPEPETQDNGEPEDAGDDKTIEAMRDAAADHVLNDGPDDNTTPESAEMTDDDYNGTYSTFDDLFED